MKKAIGIMALSMISFCMNAQNVSDKEAIKKEIILMEKKFMEDLKKNGAAYAFHKYAADDAVIKRGNDLLVKGRNAIREFYSDTLYKNAIAEWTPDHVDVSGDGTMAYTYGKYKWTMSDAAGKQVEYTGIFHTVWKRMPDGSWKYVWD